MDCLLSLSLARQRCRRLHSWRYFEYNRRMHKDSPSGIWAQAATGVQQASSFDELRTLEEGGGLWAWIKERVNLALYCPQPSSDVVASRLTGREGVYYVLKNPDASQYLKLDEEDYFLWTQMDGQRTVKDLVVVYFSHFGAFAFGRVSQLVRALRWGGFFVDQPIDVLAQVQTELAARELVRRGEKLVAAFVQHEFLIPGVDTFFSRLYRYTFLFFTWPAQLFLLALVLLGSLVFVDTLVTGEVPLLTVGDSYWLGLAALLLIYAVLIVIHESAHGLTTKHYGRQVRRGGFLIYYGYPAFFVDTMDMWLENRRARIAVSWAGPHSGLVIGALCALLSRAWPASALGPWLFKGAFVAYVSVLINLNPLLELDGYFILIDLLDVPLLRQRAFGFVRHQLWVELRDAWHKWRQGQADWLAGFTQEERLLAGFGLLAAVYTLYSLLVALYFWQTRVLTALRELWGRPGWLNQLLFFLLLGAVLIPLGAALLAWGRRTWAWLEARDFFERERNVHLTMLALLALLVLGPVLIYDPWWSLYLAWMPPVLFAGSVLGWIRAAQRYRGAEFQRMFWALAVAVGLLGLAALLRAFTGASGVGINEIDGVYALGRVATLPLVVAGLMGLSGVDLRAGPPWERGAMVALIIVSGLAAAVVARWSARQPLRPALLSVTALYLALLFVATALPNLVAFARTRFIAPWLALTAAALLMGGSVLLRAMPHSPAPNSDIDRWLALLLAGLWALAAWLYNLAHRRIRFERATWAKATVLGDEARLSQAFARFFAGFFALFQETFGTRRAGAVDDALDVMSVTADWDVEVDAGRVNDELDLSALTIWEQADRYREVLARTVDLIDNVSGSPFVARAAQAAYDSLPWPEREVLGHYVLTGTAWGAAIAHQFAAHQDARRRLVRAQPLFRHCNERALTLIVAALRDQRVPAGTVLAHQNAAVDRFILIQSGEVEVWQRDPDTGLSRVVEELRRGASLGQEAFFGVGHYDATYRTSVPSDLLILDAAACHRLVRSGVALATRVGVALKVVRLLSGMPLFNHLSPQQLSALSSQMRRRTFYGRQVVVHEGEERHSLYVVVKGEVEAIKDQAAEGETVVHVYTPGEHFGEYALFADTPYQFTYRTRCPSTLLVLDEATFDHLVTQSERMADYVEQVGSGRLLSVQHY